MESRLALRSEWMTLSSESVSSLGLESPGKASFTAMPHGGVSSLFVKSLMVCSAASARGRCFTVQVWLEIGRPYELCHS